MSYTLFNLFCTVTINNLVSKKLLQRLLFIKVFGMYTNDQIYCLDEATGIYYRAVGLTDQEEIIVYPKYVPSFTGDRGQTVIKAKGIHYPAGSMKFLASTHYWQSENVSLSFFKKFNCFVPVLNQSRVRVFRGKEYFERRASEKTPLANLMNELIEIFISRSRSKLSKHDFGIDASILVGMYKNSSDIDLLIYGEDQAKVALKIHKELIKEGVVVGPGSDLDFFIQRRKAYSPLMTDTEIVEWEKCKISGLFKGVKYSIMPKNIYQTDSRTYMHTNQYCAVRFKLRKDTVVFDPGYIEVEKENDLEIVWGPKNVEISAIVSYLPSRMGLFLPEGKTLFSIGKLYRVSNDNKFILAQFPWDDEMTSFETRFITKLELTKLDNMLPDLFDVNFNNESYTK